MEVGKGEKRKELLRLKQVSPCPRSNETGIIHPCLEIRAVSIAFHHYPLLCGHLGCVYSMNAIGTHRATVTYCSKEQATSKCI